MKSLIITTIITIATFGAHLSAQSIFGTSTNYGGNTTFHSIGGEYGTSTNYGGSTTYHQFTKWPN